MFIIERIRVGAQINQQPGDPGAIFGCSQQERRTTALVAGFQIRACAKRQAPRRSRHRAPPPPADAGWPPASMACRHRRIRRTLAISSYPLETAWSSGAI